MTLAFNNKRIKQNILWDYYNVPNQLNSITTTQCMRYFLQAWSSDVLVD